MKKHRILMACLIAAILSLGLLTGLVIAGDLKPGDEGQPPENPADPAASSSNLGRYFPVQGRLTDSGGAPLTGTYSITFRLYDVPSGGTQLCSDTNSVKVDAGLFNTEIWGDCSDDLVGTQLYMGIEVETTGEMTPRQPIFAVPFAHSLRPGANIVASVGSDAILHIENTAVDGRGLRSYATSTSGANWGIVGASTSPEGTGGYFYNTVAGIGLEAKSNTGAAIKATGSGIIQSTATSTVWVSGNGLRPFLHTDSTTIDMTDSGGAKVMRGTAGGYKSVMLPITLPGTLYGQNVTLTDLDLVWQGSSSFDAIVTTRMRRQTGACFSGSCFAEIMVDSDDYTCQASEHTTGCSLHWDLDTNNVLSANSGVIYLTLEFAFNGDTGWINIGGAKLTLKHTN